LSTTVLQGSVATRVNLGKIFNDLFIANLLLGAMVKKFWRSVRIWQSYGKKLSGTFFFRTRCRKKRFWWHNVKRPQGHLTNTKQNSMSATQQNKQSILSDRIQTAGELSESGKLQANSSVFSWRLKDASEDNDVRDGSVSNPYRHVIRHFGDETYKG